MDIGTATNLSDPIKVSEGIPLNRTIRTTSEGVVENAGRSSYWIEYTYDFVVIGTTARNALLSAYSQTMPVDIVYNENTYSGIVVSVNSTTKHDAPGLYEITMKIETDRLVVT
jgi:hypothetical protein